MTPQSEREAVVRCQHTATYTDERLAEIVRDYRSHSHHQAILAMREIEHRKTVRCDNCGSWQRKALDYGHCWSGDRLDDEFASGPADITYPGDRCEAYWLGKFDASEIRALGGDPDRSWADAERERAEYTRRYLARVLGNDPQ